MQFNEVPFTIEEEALHEHAMRCADAYRVCEAQLLEAIDQVDRRRLYSKLRQSSVYEYCLKYLKLSESVSQYFKTVARKSREIPEMRLAIANDELTVSKAARICSVINQENKMEWLKKAKELSKKNLEQEVAACTTGKAKRAIVKPVGKNLTRVSFDANDAFMAKLERAMDLENGKLPETLEAALDTYLEKHDPIKKAERARKNSARAESKDIPAKSRHAVNLRDQARCTAIRADGKRCTETKNLHIHHIIKRSDGGSHHPDNLTTLCRHHHESFHEYDDLSGA